MSVSPGSNHLLGAFLGSFLGASSAAAVACAWSVGVWHITSAQASGADFRVEWLRTYLERPFARLRVSPLLLLELLGLLFSEPCIWRLVAKYPSLDGEDDPPSSTRGEELARLAERGGLVYVCKRMRHDALECF